LFLGSFQAHAFNLEIRYDQSVTPEYRARIDGMFKRIYEVIETPEFQEKVLAYDYTCFKQNSLPSEVTNNQEILEYLESAQNYMVIKLYDAGAGINASTNPYTQTVSINRKNLEWRKDSSVANTLFHEALHVIGFGHCNKNNIKLYPWIQRSIPYKLGDFLEELYE
jgi:predicted Zn-dependent protease